MSNNSLPHADAHFGQKRPCVCNNNQYSCTMHAWHMFLHMLGIHCKDLERSIVTVHKKERKKKRQHYSITVARLVKKQIKRESFIREAERM